MTDAPFPAVPFDPRSPAHRHRMTELCRDYLREEYGRTREIALGFPVEHGLASFLLLAEGRTVGFCSVSADAPEVELVYVDPQYRRRGIAAALLTWLGDRSPTPLRVRLPLSPAGAALSASLGLQPVPLSDAEVERRDRECAGALSLLLAECARRRHKRGNPSRACRRCYLALLPKVAEHAVREYCAGFLLPSH